MNITRHLAVFPSSQGVSGGCRVCLWWMEAVVFSAWGGAGGLPKNPYNSGAIWSKIFQVSSFEKFVGKKTTAGKIFRFFGLDTANC